MKNLLISLSFVVLALGCTTKPILNFENSPVPANATMDQVKDAIVMGTRLSGWTVIDEKAGEITASVVSRSHKATVLITYNKSNYSIKLKSSEGLEQSEDGTIHRNYNRWVAKLNKYIQSKLRSI